MKKTFPAFLVLLLLAGLLPRLQAATDHFDRTKSDPLPAKPANPFLFSPPGSTPVAGPAAPALPEPAANTLADDDQILAFCVSRLKIGGQVQRGGRTHLLINSITYQEADLIPVHGNGDTVYYVKVVRIAPGEIVFGYNEAVVTLPLKG